MMNSEFKDSEPTELKDRLISILREGKCEIDASNIQTVVNLLLSESRNNQYFGVIVSTYYAMNYELQFFDDGIIFQLIGELLSDSNFDSRYSLMFFEAVSTFPESYVILFGSPDFFDTLAEYIFDNNTTALSVLSNVVRKSRFLAEHVKDLITAVAEYCLENLDIFFISFTDLLVSIASNPEYANFVAFNFSSLIQMENVETREVILNCLAVVSRHSEVSNLLFVPSIFDFMMEALIVDDQHIQRDALSLMANFSALGQFAQLRLIEANFGDYIPDLTIASTEITTALATIVFNFMNSSHSISLQFIDCDLTLHILEHMEYFPFQSKRRIVLSLCKTLLVDNDEDLIFSVAEKFPLYLPEMIDLLDSEDPEMIKLIVQALHSLWRLSHSDYEFAQALFEYLDDQISWDDLTDMLQYESIPLHLRRKLSDILNEMIEEEDPDEYDY